MDKVSWLTIPGTRGKGLLPDEARGKLCAFPVILRKERNELYQMLRDLMRTCNLLFDERRDGFEKSPYKTLQSVRSVIRHARTQTPIRLIQEDEVLYSSLEDAVYFADKLRSFVKDPIFKRVVYTYDMEQRCIAPGKETLDDIAKIIARLSTAE